jgi:hypothetical protein
MKILFLAIVACLVLSLSNSAQAQQAHKPKFDDKYCVPYCANFCRNRPGNDPLRRKCNAGCLPMCRELGH